MKRALILLVLLGNITFSYAQYSKEKLTDILTGGSTKSWTAKASKADRPEKGFTFNKNMTVQVQKSDAKGGGTVASEKWSLVSKDNIRWSLEVGSQSYEMIVSYDKGGNQFIKLTHKADAAMPLSGFELMLNPAK